MHDDRQQVERRIDRALRERIWPAVYRCSVPLRLQVWRVPGEPVPVAEALAASYEPVGVGDPWGPPWSTAWFRVRGQVPGEWAGSRVEAVLDLGFTGAGPGFQAEALVHTADGRPVKGLHPRSPQVTVADRAAGGDPVDLLVEAAANPVVPLSHPSGLGDRGTAGDRPLYHVGRADLTVLEEQVWQLALDMEVLDGLMRELSEREPRRHQILRALERCLDALDLHDVTGTAAAARGCLADVLAAPAPGSAHRLSAVGHAHLDSAWLWPLREGRRKAARTFASVLDLAAGYPELVFAGSQPQQYAWVKEDHPDLFERVRKEVEAGRWVPVGSMWVEPDVNMPGGEALARQLAYGKRFFIEELGVETVELWLPDSFGYPPSLPQLAKLAGVRWFLTQKLSWNQTDRMPHHTFWWEGLDGTRLFTHFPPVDTYGSSLTAGELAHAVGSFAEKGPANSSLAPFGYGDGGGGPTREMMERARRLRDLEGAPRVSIERPEAFFQRAHDEHPDAPVWVGELYLELHRGTYTSQAGTKAGNRRCEHLLREAELWSAAAALRGGLDYPYDELESSWKTVLLHQFHDILAGSSIAWVHRETEQEHQRVRHRLERLLTAAAGALPAGDGPHVLNSAPMARREVVAVDVPDPWQRLADGRTVGWVDVGPLAAAPVSARLPDDVAPVRVRGLELDNGLLRVRVDADGLLASVHDVEADREVLAPGGRGNLLQLHPDHPNDFDAWDLDRHYLRRHTDLTTAESVTVLDAGPLLARVEVRRRFGASTVRHVYALAAGSRRVDIDTEVDWHESEKVLKAGFGIDVRAEWSSAETQFGHLQRPTHTNTSWDQARFEVCAHRWLHVGEAGYGVALANDATYGHDVGRQPRPGGGSTTTARLTLLRAPRAPDPHADQGRHRFRYALVARADIRAAVDAGYALNLPLRPVAGIGAGPAVVAVDNPAIRVEAVKLADDRSGDVVVRLYESEGGRARGTLVAGFGCGSARAVDLLERPLADAAPEATPDGRLALGLRPFEIRTLRLSGAAG